MQRRPRDRRQSSQPRQLPQGAGDLKAHHVAAGWLCTPHRIYRPIRRSWGSWGTLALMRRLWAAFLVAVFGFTLIGPAAFADGSERTLPACCRSNGKHHCSLSRHRGDSGPAFDLGRCPSFGCDQITPQVPSAGIAKGSQTRVPAQSHSSFAPPTSDPLTHRYFDYRGLKRGPPSLS